MNNSDYTPAKYWRVKATKENGDITLFWAHTRVVRENGLVMYVLCKQDGERTWDTPTTSETRVYMGRLDDIIYERPARMSKKYAVLEVVKD